MKVEESKAPERNYYDCKWCGDEKKDRSKVTIKDCNCYYPCDDFYCPQAPKDEYDEDGNVIDDYDPDEDDLGDFDDEPDEEEIAYAAEVQGAVPRGTK